MSKHKYVVPPDLAERLMGWLSTPGQVLTLEEDINHLKAVVADYIKIMNIVVEERDEACAELDKLRKELSAILVERDGVVEQSTKQSENDDMRYYDIANVIADYASPSERRAMVALFEWLAFHAVVAWPLKLPGHYRTTFS